MGAILDGAWDDSRIADYLTASFEHPITAPQLAGAAQAMRARMVPVQAPANAIDNCGTGGDGSHSLNISTAAAFVVAGTGVPVAKHGNRSITSRSGSADVLEALGIRLIASPYQLTHIIKQAGICFMFAPEHHPSLKRVAAIRKQLGFRTIFNLLGPICNPAGVTRQLIGTYSEQVMLPMAEALRMLGCQHALIVHGHGGLDELSTNGPSRLVELKQGRILEVEFSPAQLNITPPAANALEGGDAAFNAAALTRLLDGETGAYRDAVLLNAAACLLVAETTQDWANAWNLAAAAIDSGAAKAALIELVQATGTL
ncbi:anthranilate phosphoribosyltransferase [bacterium]|nr:anthranilate phosphoribosyltransferase [bacterium]